MTIWNLRKFSELEATVIVPYERRVRRVPTRRTSSFGVAAVVAVVAISLVVTTPVVSATQIKTQAGPVSVAHSEDACPPPLAARFVGRFGPAWSHEQEDTALEAIARTHRADAPVYDEDELVDVASANQQEGLSGEAPALSRDQVLKIIRRRA